MLLKLIWPLYVLSTIQLKILYGDYVIFCDFREKFQSKQTNFQCTTNQFQLGTQSSSVTKMSFVDEEWSKLSLQVANEPDNVPHWEALINYVSKDLSKITPTPKINSFRISYDQFLFRFPILEQYWVNYAELEFKLGNTELARDVYQRGLNSNPYSLLIWIQYLRFLRKVELDYEKLVWFFQSAESKIGYHYHSYEFWSEFLEFEEKFNGKSLFYFNILRKIIELPIYNFAIFFKAWLNEIENLNHENVLKLVDEQDIVKKFKVSLDKKDLKKLDYHDLKAKLKKTYTDLYITTQFRSFELYQFEKNITLEYYVPNFYRSFQELTNWEQYISFIELNGSPKQIEQLYERALIPLANYPTIWLKYANYFIGLSQFQNAKNLLYKSLIFMNKTNAIQIQTKLVKIECALKNYIKAKDLLVTVLSVNETNIELFLELINLEYIISHENLTKFKNFVINLIQEKPVKIANVLLKHLTSFKNITIDVKLLQSLNENGKFNESLDFWLIYLNTLLLANAERAEVLNWFSFAVGKIGEDRKLKQWFDDYLSYDSQEDIEQYFKLNRKLVLTNQ